jgi:hypothetical protein
MPLLRASRVPCLTFVLVAGSVDVAAITLPLAFFVAATNAFFVVFLYYFGFCVVSLFSLIIAFPPPTFAGAASSLAVALFGAAVLMFVACLWVCVFAGWCVVLSLLSLGAPNGIHTTQGSPRWRETSIVSSLPWSANRRLAISNVRGNSSPLARCVLCACVGLLFGRLCTAQPQAVRVHVFCFFVVW